MRGPLGPSRVLGPRASAAVAAASVLLLTGHRPQAAYPQAADTTLAQVIAFALEAPELPVMAAGLLDTIGGRLSGTPTGTRAEAWAVGWLRSFGLDSVWYEIVRMPVWRRGETRVRVLDPAVLRHRRIAAVAYGYSPGISADSIPLVDAGRGDPQAIEALGLRARGAALLTDGVVTTQLVAAAVQAGAVAILRISFEPGRLPQARVAPVPEPPAPLPLLMLAHEDGLWLRRQLAAGPLSLELRVVAQTR
ncbi:MAG: hypothetical protein JSV41_03315, partial [Gemmatimonadota bacterium]